MRCGACSTWWTRDDPGQHARVAKATRTCARASRMSSRRLPPCRRWSHSPSLKDRPRGNMRPLAGDKFSCMKACWGMEALSERTFARALVASTLRAPNAVDFWRGFALLTIFVNHVPGNVFQRFTYSHISISDAAELFVFLAGWALALAG